MNIFKIDRREIFGTICILAMLVCAFSSCAKREEYGENILTSEEPTNKEGQTEVLSENKKMIEDLSIQPDYIERQIGEKFNGLTIKADVMDPEKICKGTVKKY